MRTKCIHRVRLVALVLRVIAVAHAQEAYRYFVNMAQRVRIVDKIATYQPPNLSPQETLAMGEAQSYLFSIEKWT